MKEKLQALQERALLSAAEAVELGKHWLARAKVSYGGASPLASSRSPSLPRLACARPAARDPRPREPALTPPPRPSEHPQRWRVGAAIVCIIFVVSVATAGGGTTLVAAVSSHGASHPEDGAAELHYMRMRQGMDPEAVPSLAIIGVRARSSRARPSRLSPPTSFPDSR